VAVNLAQALELRNFLERAVESGRLSVRYADSELDRKAWDVIER
jgi:hypothetical protein